MFGGSVHLQHGPAMRENAEYLRKTREAVIVSGLPALLGGDFNMSASAVSASGFAETFAAAVVVPNAPRGTYKTPGAAANTTIDMFIVDESLSAGTAEASVDYEAVPNPHWPIVLRFQPCLAETKALQFLSILMLMLDRVFGPTLPVNPWPFRRFAALEALEFAKALQAAVNRAYKHFVEGVEIEFESETGVVIEKKGLRDAMRKLV